MNSRVSGWIKSLGVNAVDDATDPTRTLTEIIFQPQPIGGGEDFVSIGGADRVDDSGRANTLLKQIEISMVIAKPESRRFVAVNTQPIENILGQPFALTLNIVD